MITFESVIAVIEGMRETDLRAWIEEGWVRPESERGVLIFQEIDVARVRLIHDLRRDLAIGNDAVPVVLNLLDQLYAMRRRVRAMNAAIDAQPTAVRRTLRVALRATPKPAVKTKSPKRRTPR
ncbi:MAG TPA: chaperone modulator CbpM [Stellaceae bacterium]